MHILKISIWLLATVGFRRQDHIQKLKSIKQVKTPAYITDSEIEEGGTNEVKEEVNIECRKLILRFIFHYFNPISHKSPFPFSCLEWQF